MKTEKSRWIRAAAMGATGLVWMITCHANAQVAEQAWQYTYNELGLIETVDGPRIDVNDLTTYSYDASGNLLTVTNALGHVTTYSDYDVNGNPGSIVDANGLETRFEYDVRGRVSSSTVIGALDGVDYPTEYQYYPDGVIKSIFNPGIGRFTFKYNDANQLVAIANQAGESIEFSLDAAGNRTGQYIRNNIGSITYSVQQVYDELSRVIEITGNAGQRDQVNYDPNDNATAFENARQAVSTQAYDGLNRVIQQIDPLLGETHYTYDSHGRIRSVTDANGNTTTYTYDALGNLLSLESPDTGTTTYTYDTAGNRISGTDARGITAQYRYDALNRLIEVRYPDFPEENVTYEYDGENRYGVGRLAHVRSQTFSASFEYNALGDVVQKVVDMQGQRYTTRYDHQRRTGLLNKITYPSDRRVNYTTTRGRISHITTQLSNGKKSQVVVKRIKYLPFGPAMSFLYGNGLMTTNDYDLDYRLTRIDVQSVSTIANLNYFYDLTNNVTGIQDNLAGAKSQSFEYDLADRLIGAEGVYGRLDYLYDDIGNRLSETRNQVTDAYDYSADSNRLVQVLKTDGTRDFEYDAAGNMTRAMSAAGDIHTYAYNAAGRLSAVAINGEPLAEYQYNPFGQRVSKKLASGLTELYHYDEQGQLLAVSDASGNVQREYLYRDRQQVALVVHSEPEVPAIYYIHSDHLNTPKALTDRNQQVVWMADYEPFGKIAQQDQDTILHLSRFPGQHEDKETGLYYNYYRDYDPSIGRYIQSDPLGLYDGLNTYAYVGGNPLAVVDPFGLYGCRWVDWGNGQLVQLCDSDGGQPYGDKYCPSGYCSAMPPKDPCLQCQVESQWLCLGTGFGAGRLGFGIGGGIGSAVPGVGTAGGAAVGGIAGMLGGTAVCSEMKKVACEKVCQEIECGKGSLAD